MSFVVRVSSACLLIGVILVGRDAECAVQDYIKINTERHNFTEAEKACKTMGFDGLAITNSPEEFAYIVRVTEWLRKFWGLWLALRYNPEVGSVVWDDGTVPAPDMPWITLTGQMPKNPKDHQGGLRKSGVLSLWNESLSRYSICGNRE
ncbi:hypothetical protein PoB_001099100 [Plakobranchus ocellatus]|uniref:C-type lectin domain-containing protein n=1 Tax=Plakobranchus ocellatus TaxID=259542 RepID=A0AAV3YAY5_9GAST|nr:hypothetical protein PoB_001099100 [Plakobranchus ocellatus]